HFLTLSLPLSLSLSLVQYSFSCPLLHYFSTSPISLSVSLSDSVQCVSECFCVCVCVCVCVSLCLCVRVCVRPCQDEGCRSALVSVLWSGVEPEPHRRTARPCVHMEGPGTWGLGGRP